MKTTYVLSILAAMTTLGIMPLAACAQILITGGTNIGHGTIGEYTTGGTPVNAALVSGLDSPVGIAVSGNDIFVVNFSSGTIGEYTTGGATVNAALVSGLNHPIGIAASGDDLFVVNFGSGTVGEYTTSGATVNAALVSGLSSPLGIAVSGADLFVSGGNIHEYTTSGALVNNLVFTGAVSAFGMAVSGQFLFGALQSGFGEGSITGGNVIWTHDGLQQAEGIAVLGSNLFVADEATGIVGEYTTSGATVNAAFITGVAGASGIAVIPEPSTWALLAMGAGALLLGRRCR